MFVKKDIREEVLRMTEQKEDGSFLSRLKESIHNSAGEMFLGMSDGVVSIFGLVLGVAAGARSGNVVFLAGATMIPLPF